VEALFLCYAMGFIIELAETNNGKAHLVYRRDSKSDANPSLLEAVGTCLGQRVFNLTIDFTEDNEVFVENEEVLSRLNSLTKAKGYRLKLVLAQDRAIWESKNRLIREGIEILEKNMTDSLFNLDQVLSRVDSSLPQWEEISELVTAIEDEGLETRAQINSLKKETQNLNSRLKQLKKNLGKIEASKIFESLKDEEKRIELDTLVLSSAKQELQQLQKQISEKEIQFSKRKLEIKKTVEAEKVKLLEMIALQRKNQ
jgi:hypothetical protein